VSSAQTSHLDAGTERRLGEAFDRQTRAPDRRERLANRLFLTGFVAAASALAVLAPTGRELDAALAVALLVAYTVADRVEFSVGAGYGAPTQLVFVPMLLLLPTPIVPLLVAAGSVLGAALRAVRGPVSPRRWVFATTDAWYSLGPALVLVLADAQEPEWRHWPVYLLALCVQLLLDTVITAGRAGLAYGIPPREMLRELALVHRVDVLLAPIGLLAAFAAAAAPHPATALLVLPLVGLLGVLSHEREARIARTLELGQAYRGTALLLRDLLEEQDEYTGRHTQDVVALAVRTCEALGTGEDVRREAELGAMLHDIGKIAIPTAILNKPGRLDADEWQVMQTHTIEGERMLRRIGGLLGRVGLIVRASHERWDGTGYPDGLAGEDIPLAARIVSVCDAYNAMTTNRPYRPPIPSEGAVAELGACAGTQFDPALVPVVVEVVRSG
jgi:HD-GYP domain-containing protein (c-di-GMP phosphodiesterase class II)